MFQAFEYKKTAPFAPFGNTGTYVLRQRNKHMRYFMAGDLPKVETRELETNFHVMVERTDGIFLGLYIYRHPIKSVLEGALDYVLSD